MPPEYRTEAVPPDAIEALKRGNKIEAIKLTRLATSMGLKEAKETVEALIATDPELKSAYSARSPFKGTGLVRLVVNLILIAAVIYIVLIKTRQ